MPIVKNQEIELTIESLTATGSGVGHSDGFAVFVAGSVPGDRLLVHIIKAKKTYAVGKIARILTPSPDRVAPDCPVFPRCGGCAWRNMRYEAEAREKRQRVEENFKRLAHLPLPCTEILTPESPLRYRNKAQYPVAKENGAIQIGFFSPRTHRVIDCADCLLQPAEFAGIVAAFRAFLEETGVSVYDAESGKGLVRHLYLRKAYATGEIMVCVVINGETLPEAERLVEFLRAENQNIKSILCNHNTEKTNVILGDACTLLWGQSYITDELCGVQVRLSAQSFYQVNHDMAERLYRKAAEFAELDGSETVLDLYCGTGTIGLSMAKQAKKIIGAEIVPQAVEDARENARRNGIENAEFFCGDASDAAKRFREDGVCPDVVILDPPRKGCAEDVLRTVAEMNPRKIVYVSCDSATLARDAAILAKLGYPPEKLCAADLFPRTVHVESVCLFSRNEAENG